MALRRPAPDGRRTGILGWDHFQVAYATTDIERAKGIFRDRLGIREYRQLAGALPAGGHIHIELAWVGNLMYELLTASGAGSAPFTAGLPETGFALRHHHLGYVVDDEAGWETLEAEIAASGGATVHAGDTPGFMRTRIVAMPALGHALEFILPERAGLDFFEAVPVS